MTVEVVGRGNDAHDPADDQSDGATVLDASASGSTDARKLSGTDLADWYRVDLAAGQSYEFESTGKSDVAAALYADPDDLGPLVQATDGGTRRNFLLPFTPTQTGTYWIRVQTTVVGKKAKYTLTWRRL